LAKRQRSAGGEREGEGENERDIERTLLGNNGGLQWARARSPHRRAVKPGPLHLVRCRGGFDLCPRAVLICPRDC